jgi:hypothetical protein
MLRIPNPSFFPTAASSKIENYIEKCRCRLLQHLTQLPQSTTSYDYKKQSIFKNIIDSLTTEDTIIITQADKNMGPVIVDRTWYEKEALRQLSDTSTYTRLLAPPSIFNFKKFSANYSSTP